MERFYPQGLDEKTIEYFIKHSTTDELLYNKIVKKASELNIKNLSISPFEANIIATITKIVKPRKAVEIGCFLGYSSITIAKSMPDDGKLYAIEKEEKYAQAAIEIIDEEGLSNKIIIINDDATGYLSKLTKISPFDICFIDADKENYPFYFKWAVKNVKSGGVIIAHNVFLKGKLFYEGDDKEQNKKSRGMREFLYNFYRDENIISRSIIPSKDGIALAVVG